MASAPDSRPTKGSPVTTAELSKLEPPPTIEQPPVIGDVHEGFEARTYVSQDGQRLLYRLFRPPNYDPRKRYPLIVFLHGASGRGTDNLTQLTGSRTIGTTFWTDTERQSRHPAFVIAPQVDGKKHDNWVRQWRRPAAGLTEPLEMLVELLPQLAREFPIDPSRLYLTGYSMGGFGTWIGISRHPELFAGALPICGGGDPSPVSASRTPVWAFHGTADRIVPVRRSREMVKALKSAGSKPRYNEYNGVGHSVWERAFEEPDLEEWLFSNRARMGYSEAARKREG